MFNITITNLNDTIILNGRKTALGFLFVNEIFAIFGNGLFVYTAIGRPDVRQPRTYVYMAFVSLTNLGVSLFVVPFKLITLFAQRWILGPEMCYFNGIMIVIWLPLSVYSMTVLSIHKYFSIARPMFRRDSYKSVVSLISATVIIVLLMATIVSSFTSVWFDRELGLCTVSYYHNLKLVGPFLITLSYALPTVITAFCYWRTVVALQRHSTRMKLTSIQSKRSIKGQKRITRTLFVAFILYIISWTPFFVYGVIITIYREQTAKVAVFKRVAYNMGFLSCAMNPWIYLWRNVRLRKSLSSVFKNNVVIRRASLASTIFNGQSSTLSPDLSMRKKNINDNDSYTTFEVPKIVTSTYTPGNNLMSYLRTPPSSTLYESDETLENCATPDMRCLNLEADKENDFERCDV